ncbi:MAG: hypothetical protein ABS939_00190 [Psychrobacillus sp.]
MKTITTFEDGKNVSVARFDGDLKIGERQVYISDYILALMEELPMSDILATIAERETELEEFFQYLNVTKEFSSFLVKIMELAQSNWLIHNSSYTEFVRFALEKIDLVAMEPESTEKLFKSLLKQVKALPDGIVYTELLQALLGRVIRDTQKNKIINDIIPEIVKLARDMDSPLLKEWFDLMVPHVDGKWLLDAAERSSQTNPIELVATSIPKNCVFMNATSNVINYVLEIPKSRIRVKFHDVAYEDVGHPRLLSIVSVSGKRAVGMKFFAVEEKGDINGQTKLFKYPFSNVHGSGSVCWSGYSQVEIKSAKDIEMLPLMFLSTTNNTHLNGDVRNLFSKLSGKDFLDESLEVTNFKLKNVL